MPMEIFRSAYSSNSLFACFAAMTALVCFSSAHAQERFALLIGNQSYAAQVGRLKNPINDVKLIAKALAAVGFKKRNIRIVENADRVTLLDAVDAHIDRLNGAGKGAVGFFYYSGHGVANKRDKRNYVIPIGVGRLDRRVWYKTVALDDIVSKLSDLAPNAAHFVVFDACRNVLNAPARGGKGFEPVATRRGMLIAFSTDPGETASDEGPESGPYAAALASELVKRGQDHLNLFQNVKERVYRTTRTQVPWTRDGMLQRVYLAGKRKGEPAPYNLPKRPVTTTFDQQAELTFWNSVKDSKDPATLRTYLKQYPKGKLAPLARLWIRKLEASEEKKTLALIKDAELRAAEEKKQQAQLARLIAERKVARARQAEELRKAREAARKAQGALKLAEQQRADALKAAQEARAEKNKANREVEKTTGLQVASLPKEPVFVGKPSTETTDQQKEVIDATALSKLLQAELVRVGCLIGPVDGIWGVNSRRALVQFTEYSKSKLRDALASRTALELIRRYKKRVCPISRERRNLNRKRTLQKKSVRGKPKPEPRIRKTRKTRICTIYGTSSFWDVPCPGGCVQALYNKQPQVRCKER